MSSSQPIVPLIVRLLGAIAEIAFGAGRQPGNWFLNSVSSLQTAETKFLHCQLPRFVFLHTQLVPAASLFGAYETRLNGTHHCGFALRHPSGRVRRR